MLAVSLFFWKDNIKTDLKYVECENVDLSHVARDVVHWHYFCVHGIETTRCFFLAGRLSASQEPVGSSILVASVNAFPSENVAVT